MPKSISVRRETQMKHDAVEAMAEVQRCMVNALYRTIETSFHIDNIEEHEPDSISDAITDQAKKVRYQLEIVSQKLDELEATAKVAVKK